MANDRAKKDSESRGKKKAARHSFRTRENKARRADKLARRFAKARERRMSNVAIDPISGRRSRLAVAVVQQRIIQQDRIEHKAKQRKAFAKLSPREKVDHRLAAPDGARTPRKRESK